MKYTYGGKITLVSYNCKCFYKSVSQVDFPSSATAKRTVAPSILSIAKTILSFSADKDSSMHQSGVDLTKPFCCH